MATHLSILAWRIQWMQEPCSSPRGRKESDTLTNFTFFRKHIKKQRFYFVNKGLPSQGYHFSSSHVWM